MHLLWRQKTLEVRPEVGVILNASAFVLPLADESVHLICTSPPYWSLRKYVGLAKKRLASVEAQEVLL